MGWCPLLPFESSWILPVGGSLSAPCSLYESPLVRSLMPGVIILPGQGGWFQSMVP